MFTRVFPQLLKGSNHPVTLRSKRTELAMAHMLDCGFKTETAHSEVTSQRPRPRGENKDNSSPPQFSVI